MPNYGEMAERWMAGGVSRGNREGALAAEKRQQRFRGGEKCPAGCGSIIAYQVGMAPRRSVDRHTSNPRACLNHPDNKRKPKK
ncbi:MAG TPA: hypothetical protein VM759_08635 [Longimicrobium sp.]|jgi:hypothetical protein|nr:hypothetical protein [Longimicrobium sp.]